MTYKDNIELVLKAQSGDKKALDDVTKLNLKLVNNIVRNFLNRGYEYDDLFQIGCMGLMKAIKRFNIQEYNVQFSTYAMPMITGEIKRFIRDDNKNLVKVPRQLKELGKKLYYIQLELSNKLGQEITYSELAEYTGYSVEEIREVMTITLHHNRSFEEVIHYGGSGDNDITLGDRTASDINLEDQVIESLEVEHLYNCIKSLPERQKNVIILRLEGKTQIQVAKILRISQVEVSRSQKRALKNLKEILTGKIEKSIHNARISAKDKIFKMFEEGIKTNEISKELNIKARTVYSYKALWRKEKKINVGLFDITERNKNKIDKNIPVLFKNDLIEVI